jgi:hypothetical protein
MKERGEVFHASIGELHDGHVGFFGALVADMGSAGLAEEIEEGRFPRCGEADDTDTHDLKSFDE